MKESSAQPKLATLLDSIDVKNLKYETLYKDMYSRNKFLKLNTHATLQS